MEAKIETMEMRKPIKVEERKTMTCEEFVVNELIETKEMLNSLGKQFRDLDLYCTELTKEHQELVDLAKIIAKNTTIGEFGAKINGYYVRNEELGQALLDLYKMFENTPKREEEGEE